MKYRLSLTLCFLITFANAQKLIKDYVIQHNAAIKTIEPDSTDYSDLEVIGNAIGNAKVVMLGEQDHGDAPTFLAKTRLIKYLHEKKGFNVLAFESDFFALNEGWDRLNKTHPAIDTFLKKNIFPVWTVCNTCSTLFYNYIPATYATSNPLIISGFDNQQYLNYSRNHFGRSLDSVLRASNAPITKAGNYTSQIVPSIDSMWVWDFKTPKDSVKVNQMLGYLQTIQGQLAELLPKDSFWRRAVDNAFWQVMYVRQEIRNKGKMLGNFDDRDIQMAKNLRWLNEVKFKDQKIIVWAADFHVAKSLTNTKDLFFHPNATMGDTFVTLSKNENRVYVLGFSSYEGTAGRLGFAPYKVTHARNSFETWVNEKYKYAFVDFNAYNATNNTVNEDFYLTALGHRFYEAKWNHIFNGIFFIRDMYPCEGLKK